MVQSCSEPGDSTTSRPPLTPLAVPAALPATFLASVPAAATTAWLLRERFTAWLTALRWPDLATEDVVFALSEAVSNCTEHAYPPDAPDPVIEISATIEPDDITERTPADQNQPDAKARQPRHRLRVRIRDYGTWRPISPEPNYRGRGLQMMTALMDDVVIHHNGTDQPGTEVILVSPPVTPVQTP